jgi:uncharacterized membrane protein
VKPFRLSLALVTTCAVLVVGTVAGLIVLWPGDYDDRLPNAQQLPTFDAVTRGVVDMPCQDPFSTRCARVRFEITEGPDEGEQVELPMADTIPDTGDRVRLFKVEVPPDVEPGPNIQPYSFADFERLGSMLGLALAFCAAVVALGRWRGLRALVGLGASLAVVLFFIVPAILDGKSPVGVAIVGALAVMIATMAFAHGIGPKTIAASLGTAVSLLLTVGLAVGFTELAHLSGFSSEEAAYLRINVTGISLEGLVIAGMVIAALGVLDDVTISQASTVLALHQANPEQSFAVLFGRALNVGRDHIAATVNTLVLAYAGASLPILLVFSVGNASFGTAINGEAVAENVVAMLVGSIGLVAAVPVTTALAAVLAARLPPSDLRVEAHGHAH